MENKSLKLNVIEVKQRVGVFYIASIKAKDLLNISHVDRMRMINGEDDRSSYLGIQRTLKEDRIKTISNYVKTLDASFPTSILLSVTEDCAELEENAKGEKILILKALPEDIIKERIELGLIEPKDILGKESYELKGLRYSGIAKILDGQHRLAGLARAIEELKNNNQQLQLFEDETNESLLNALENFELNVVIFIGYDLHNQAKLFGIVNLAQTKVNKSLVYNLEEYAETRSPQSVCHNIAQIIDKQEKSPFYGRIKMLGCKTAGRDETEPLTQAVFVESLMKMLSKDPEKERDLLKRKSVMGKGKYLEHTEKEKEKYVFRNLFENKKDGELLDVIWNYFSAINKKWTEAWNNVDNSLLTKNNCFRALMRYLQDIYKEINKEKPSVEDFYEFFEKFEIKDEDFDSNKQNFPRGDGGMSKFYKYLSGQITYADLKNN